MSKFWKEKSLAEMTDEEWERLCDGCGQCCLNKLMDAESDDIYFTNVACNQLNLQSCRCNNYEDRHDFEPDCIKLTYQKIKEINWLPKTCAYRLIYENKPLFDWHPLIAGNKKKMHEKQISVREIAVYEFQIKNWEDHIIKIKEE